MLLACACGRIEIATSPLEALPASTLTAYQPLLKAGLLMTTSAAGYKRTFITLVLAGCILATPGCVASTPMTHSGGDSTASEENLDPSEKANGNPTPTAEPTPAKIKPTGPALLPGGEQAPLTPSEQERYEAGEYVAPTEEHPAYNVYEPNFDPKVKEQGIEGPEAQLKRLAKFHEYEILANHEMTDEESLQFFTKDYKFTERPSNFDTRTPEDRGDTPEESMKFDDMTSAGYWPVNPTYKVEILNSQKMGSGDSAEWVVTYAYKRNRYAWYNQESLETNKIYRNRGMNREMKATFIYVKGEGWKIKELEVLKKLSVSLSNDEFFKNEEY